MTDQPERHCEQKRCQAIIEFGDDYGDNTTTFHCQLEKGHLGPHVERGKIGCKDIPYTLKWGRQLTLIESEDGTSIRPMPESEDEKHRIFALLSDLETRKEIVDRLSQPWGDDVLREIWRIRKDHDAHVAAEAIEAYKKGISKNTGSYGIYYPISEGELRAYLNADHIPFDATSKQIRDAETKALWTILNRDTVASIANRVAAEAREEVLKELDTFASGDVPEGYLDDTAKNKRGLAQKDPISHASRNPRGTKMKPFCFGGKATIGELMEKCKCGSCSHFKECKRALGGA
ncbi:MAG: hypothetical protein PHC39_04975 [Proteiniphilum sp.]|nr:hypothetical protein [Proteiniphilum sp.]